MTQTPVSLLERLQKRPDDEAIWRRVVEWYRPLIRDWLRRHGFAVD